VSAFPRAAAWAAAVAVASGCVYYNGMYNARHAEQEALRYERQGRAAEARDQWLRAVTHAESVATRHPNSEWAEEALLLSGRGSIHIGDFGAAAVALERAARLARTPAQRAEALVQLGRANIALGRFVMARADLDSALAVPPREPGEALLLRGRALRELGESAAALADFAASSDPRAPAERARIHLARRDTAAALAQLDALAATPSYDEGVWLSALDSLAGLGAGSSASRLAGRLAVRADVGRDARARLLLGDGDRRLAAGDTAAARGRYREAIRTAPDSVESHIAAVRLLRLAVTGASSAAELDSLSALLSAAVALGGAPAREAEGAARLLDRAYALARDTVVADASWFLRAEILRDSLGAVPLAARDFAEMVRRFPASPWTPKGLLAAIASGHPATDSLRALLDARYAASPYRRAALGLPDAPAAYAALEDSLARAIAAAPRGGRRETEERPRTPAAPRGGTPASRRDSLEASSSAPLRR
jgi:tetratricopeptide (TPR) repeat protein